MCIITDSSLVSETSPSVAYQGEALLLWLHCAFLTAVATWGGGVSAVGAVTARFRSCLRRSFDLVKVRGSGLLQRLSLLRQQMACVQTQNMCQALLAHTQQSEIDAVDKFRITQLPAEVTILSHLLERLGAMSRPNTAGTDWTSANMDENMCQTVLNHWYTVVQLVTKIVLLLWYLGDILKLRLDLAEAEAVLDIVLTNTNTAVEFPDFSLYLSSIELRSLWASSIGKSEAMCPWKTFLGAIEGELETAELLKTPDQLSWLTQCVCSIPTMVSIFRLDDHFQAFGLVTVLAVRQGDLPSADSLSTEIASITTTANPCSMNDINAVVRLLRKIDVLLTVQDEQSKQLDARFTSLLRLLNVFNNVDGNSTVATVAKDVVERAHKLRTASEYAARQQLHKLYQSAVNRHTELAQHQPILEPAMGPLASTSSDSSESGPPHSVIVASKNFHEVMENVRKQATDADVLGSKLTDLVRKLHEDCMETVTAPDAALLKSLRIKDDDRFIYGTSAKLILPKDIIPILGVFYIFRRTVAFQRTFFQELGAVTMPLFKIQRLVKIRSTLPPFFEDSIQIQLTEKGVSYNLLSLDRRDLVCDLLQLLMRQESPTMSILPRDSFGMIVEEGVFENERYFPISGFQPNSSDFFDKRGHYSDEEGNPKPREGLKAPAGFRWISKWSIDRSILHLDKDGWEYALSWKTPWGERTATSFVRRRKWVRQRVCLPPDFSDPTRIPSLGREVEFFSDGGISQGKAVL